LRARRRPPSSPLRTAVRRRPRAGSARVRPDTGRLLQHRLAADRRDPPEDPGRAAGAAPRGGGGLLRFRFTLALVGLGAVLADSNVSSELMLVDPLRMKRLGFVDIGGGDLATVRTTFWPVEQRLYAVVARLVRDADGNATPVSTSLLAIDPATRSVVGKQPL